MAKYIGGEGDEPRIKYINTDSKLVSVVYRLAEEYGVNPHLVLNRLTKEGLVDRAIREHNADVKNNRSSMSILDRGVISVLKDLGLDDSHSNLKDGKIKLNREIEYDIVSQKNAKSRLTYAAQPKTSIDALELFTAQIRSFQDEIKRQHPELNSKQLDIFTNAAYNMGLEKTNEHYRKGTIKLTDDGNYGFENKFKGYNGVDIANLKPPIKIEDRGFFRRISNKLGFSEYNINHEYEDVNGEILKYGGIRSRYGWGGINDTNPINNTIDLATNRKGGSIFSSYIKGSTFKETKYAHHSANYYVKEKGWNPENVYIRNNNTGEVIMYNDASDELKSYWEGVTGNGNYTIGMLTNEGVMTYNNLKNKDIEIFNNMQDKISQDIEQRRQIETVARYGGLLGIRKKYNLGGTYVPTNSPQYQSAYSGNVGWGMQVKPEDVTYAEYNADNEGVIGQHALKGVGTGVGIGGSLGAMIGSIIPGIGTLIGGLIGSGLGALFGGGIGAGVGSSRKSDIEKERQIQLAETKNINRQVTMNNMQSRQENDVAKIRTFKPNTGFINNSFYQKYGGMIGCRRKLEYGGHIIPNSDDSAVAYGRTHNQVNPITGQTGVTYGNAEVEGGGFINGQELAGEVIRQTPMGDQIFTNSLNIPGTNQTYAEYAKRLTDSKGTLEKDIEMTKVALDKALNMFSQSKLTKSKTGTATRNIEKLASKLNIKTAQLAKLDAELDNLFVTQEQDATNLGLRETTPMVAKFGGYRPKYKFGIPELNLVSSGLGFVANMLASGLKARSNRESLAFMKNLKTPKMNHLETQYHRIDTSPYDDAERKALIENRRLDKWLEGNTNNVQVLRNQKRQSNINYLDQLSSILSGKSAYLTSVYDKNYNARVATNNANRSIDYQNLVTDYNKDLAYLKEMQRVKEGEVNDYMTAINGLVQGLGTYTNQRIMLASYPDAVQNEFYFGKKKSNSIQPVTSSKPFNIYNTPIYKPMANTIFGHPIYNGNNKLVIPDITNPIIYNRMRMLRYIK